jgi:uncharacterized OB-fold protein
VTARGPAFRLLPRLDRENEFFWTSGADGQLRFLRCRQCRTYIHPPAPICPECLSQDVAPEAVSGRGRVVSFTVNVQPFIPGSDPYVIGLVAIDEQESVRLMTNLVEAEPEGISVGMAVEVSFEENGDVYLPLFRPIAEAPQ